MRFLTAFIYICLFLYGCSTRTNEFLVDPSAFIDDELIQNADSDDSDDSDEETEVTDTNIYVTLSVNTSSIDEDDTDGIMTLRATLSEAVSDICTVNVAISGTATESNDYTIDSITLVIPADSTSISTTVHIIDDSDNEGSEMVIFDIDSIICDDSSVLEYGTQTVSLTIIDDDGPFVYLALDESTLSTNESITEGNSSTIVAYLLDDDGNDYTLNTGESISVSLSTSGTASSSSDYAIPTTITISENTHFNSIDLTTIDNSIYEESETAIISISSVSGTNASIGSVSSSTVTITDDESAPNISLTFSSTTINEGETSTITASSTNAADAAITVNLSYNDITTSSGDYSSSSSITIPSESTSASISFTATDDTIYETSTDELLTVGISGGSLSTASYDYSTTTLSITDNNSAPTVILSVADSSLQEGDTTTITALFSGTTATYEDVTVTVSSSGSGVIGTDYTLSSSSFTIFSGSTSAESAITITAIDDGDFSEISETVNFAIQSVSGGDVNQSSDIHSITISDPDPGAF